MELCDKNIKNMHKFLYSFTPMWCRVLQFDVFILIRALITSFDEEIF